MPDSLFELDGDRIVPTELARGPWSPDALHGGPTAALVTRALEGEIGGGEVTWGLTRLTLELLRPVPVAPLTVRTRTLRPGRKVTLAEAVVEADGREVARAVGLGVRQVAQALPARIQPIPGPPPAAAAETASTPPGAGEWVAFHNSGVEMRFVAGQWRVPGPVMVWIRLRVPIVAGEVPSAVCRATAVADFGNGVSSELDWGTWTFLNPDLTVHLARPPVGEWVCLDARTVLGGHGAGVAESALSDEVGVFGRAVQSLLVEPRG